MRGRRPVMAVASTGGHWIQLMRLAPAFADRNMCYVSTGRSGSRDVVGAPFHVVVDANRDTWFKMLVQILQVAVLVLRYRPCAVVTTGAAAGYWACRFGGWVGARTLWIDSIANAEELSLSGRKAERIADLVLTQWEHLAAEAHGGPAYRGEVI